MDEKRKSQRAQTSTTDEKDKPTAETTDGQPPGAHAPSSIGTGGINEKPDETPDIPGQSGVDPTLPQGHVEDPTASPKEQAANALATDAAQKRAAAQGKPVGPGTTGTTATEEDEEPPQDGRTRVRLTANVTVDGRLRNAGELVDIPNEDLRSLRGSYEKV